MADGNNTPTARVFTQGTSAKANEPVSPRDGLSLVSRGYSTYPRNYDTAFDYNREIKVVHREQVANPAPLGLAAFGLTTALLQGSNTAITEPETSFFVYAFALFFGGLAQLLAGMWEFKRQNTFGATAFTSYGGFWLSYAIFGILASAGIFKGAPNGEQMLLALWGIYTFILMVPTLMLNVALFLLFFTLSVLFFLLAGGVQTLTWTRIGGWWGLVVAGIAFYIAAADVINEEYGMTVLPLGKWQVGRPIMRKCRAIFGRIPPCSFLIRASKREDAMAGYSPVGKKGSAQAMNDAEQGLPRVSVDPVDLHADERLTGRPHLMTTESMVGTSFEGAAVRQAAASGDVRSAIGPY